MYESKKIQAINDIIFGAKEIKIFNLKNFFLNRFKHAANSYINYPSLNSAYQQLPRFFLEIIFLSSALLIFIFSLIFKEDYLNTFKILSIYAVAAIRIIPSISTITKDIQSLNYNMSTIQTLENFLLDPKIKTYDYNNKIFNDNFQKLKISNLNFRYGNKIIFKNYSCIFKNKTINGIVGKSGSGKTTLLDIICGLIPVDKTDIELDHQSIEFQNDNWKRIISYVPQIPYIFRDTIRNNIALGSDSQTFDEDRLNEAIKNSNLELLLENLPNGKDYQLSDSGENLSVGQKQRIGIARALYHNKKIIILDEPTSALDGLNKLEVINLINNLKNKKMIIIVSHDKDIISICDNVIYV